MPKIIYELDTCLPMKSAELPFFVIGFFLISDVFTYKLSNLNSFSSSHLAVSKLPPDRLPEIFPALLRGDYLL